MDFYFGPPPPPMYQPLPIYQPPMSVFHPSPAAAIVIMIIFVLVIVFIAYYSTSFSKIKTGPNNKYNIVSNQVGMGLSLSGGPRLTMNLPVYWFGATSSPTSYDIYSAGSNIPTGYTYNKGGFIRTVINGAPMTVTVPSYMNSTNTIMDTNISLTAGMNGSVFGVQKN